MSRADDIIDLIDGGLQSTFEPGYGHDARGKCARCQSHQPVEGGDLCAGCRAFLLEDGPDPMNDWPVAPYIWAGTPRVVPGAPARVTADGSVVGYLVSFTPEQNGRSRHIEGFDATMVIIDDLNGLWERLVGDLTGLSVSIEAVRDAASRMATVSGMSIRSAMEGIATVVRSETPRLIPLPDPPEVMVERARHGSAAVCPRHGTTRGGTCLRCARGR